MRTRPPSIGKGQQRMGMSVRSGLRKVANGLYLWWAVPRLKEHFASHLPVLIAVTDIMQPKHLLELGSGLFSTPALLDRRVFSTLETITSVEDNDGWLDKVQDDVGTDSRHHLMGTASVPDWCRTADLAQFDVIFIDDSTEVAARRMTIEAVLVRASARTIIVIHDFHFEAYQQAVGPPWETFVFEALEPPTGVAFQRLEFMERFREADQMIRDNRQKAVASDYLAWSAILRKQVRPA